MPDSINFNFLNEYDPIFLQLASAAEWAFASAPNPTLIKLRQLGEALAQDLAARSGIAFDETTRQTDLLWKLQREIRLDPTIREIFHALRIEGNKATHQFRTQHKEAMSGLKMARTLTVWYHQSFSKQSATFKPGPFTPPQGPQPSTSQPANRNQPTQGTTGRLQPAAGIQSTTGRIDCP